MAISKVKFDKIKMEIKMPKVEGKADTKKMQLAVNKALSRGAQKGSTYVEKSLREALDNSLQSQWTWIQGSRDIVDTGRLKSSLEIKAVFSQTKVSFKIAYNVPYAGLVHYGGMIKPYGNRNAADVLIPARPWVTAVLEGSHGQPQFDMRTPFDLGISEAWSSQFGT